MTPLRSVQTKAPETERKQFFEPKEQSYTSHWASSMPTLKNQIKKQNHISSITRDRKNWAPSQLNLSVFNVQGIMRSSGWQGEFCWYRDVKKNAITWTLLDSPQYLFFLSALSFSPSPVINQQHSTPRQSLSLVLLHPSPSQVQQASLPHSHFLPMGPQRCATITVPSRINQQEQSIKCNMQWEWNVSNEANAVSSLECKFR